MSQRCGTIAASRQASLEEATYRAVAASLADEPRQRARIGGLACRHWSIENELHWGLDMVFDEDQSRIRDRSAATNLALLRKLALLKREQSDPRMSIKMKRRRVGWDNDYLFTVLAAVARISSHPSADPIATT